MNEVGSGNGSEDDSKGSWASEQLPMVVRRGLLDRELKKMAARQGQGQHGGHVHDSQGHPHPGHPTAEASSQDEHAG
jgi:hypothetical protein